MARACVLSGSGHFLVQMTQLKELRENCVSSYMANLASPQCYVGLRSRFNPSVYLKRIR